VVMVVGAVGLRGCGMLGPSKVKCRQGLEGKISGPDPLKLKIQARYSCQ
jgi:hypothetical protein